MTADWEYRQPHTEVPPLRPLHVGGRVARREDRRLLLGAGRFVGDLDVPVALDAVFVRSPVAHARLLGVETGRAQAAAGVRAVWTAADAAPLCAGLESGLTTAGLAGTVQPLLAERVVRHVGEAVAVVVADDAYAAEDAASLVELELEPLPAVVGWDGVLGDARANDTLPRNVVYDRERSFGAGAAALEGAALRVAGRFAFDRVSPAPLEPRGCVADWDAAEGTLRLRSSTQMPFLVRSLLAGHLGLPEHAIEVEAPDVGGGFGQKGNLFPEEVLACLLARALGRPVRWLEDRRENLLAGSHAKAQLDELELGLDGEGRVLGLDARIAGDGGAYNTCPFTLLVEPLAAAANLTGVYRIPHVRERVRAGMTNTCPIGSYRGIGYGAAQVAREALLDRAARALGLSPFEIRRRNVVRPGDFPYRSHNAVYTEGSYLESLEALEETLGYEALLARQREARAAGRLLGIGISVFNELTGGGTRSAHVTGFDSTSHDTATVRIEPDGSVSVTTSLVSQGQGHATSLAQVAADALGVELEQVRVRAGGTSTGWGLGTWGSRSAVIGAGTIARAAEPLRRKLLLTATHLLEAAPEDLVLEQGRAYVAGAPQRAVAVSELAETLYFSWERRPAGLDPALEATAAFDPAFPIVANGAHGAVVEVDAETGAVRVERVVAVEDCGTMINPALVEGQIHGGVAQAIGQAFLERLVHDEEGQLLTASLADYLLPTACDVPPVEVVHLETPSPYTPGGVKGMGEAAMISVPAALLNAVNDALVPLGAELSALPMTPERVLAAISRAG